MNEPANTTPHWSHASVLGPPLPIRERRIWWAGIVASTILSLHLAVSQHSMWIPATCGAGISLALLNIFFFRITLLPYDRRVSAFSSDGVHFVPEPGVRMDVGRTDIQVYYPRVVALVDGFRMYYRAGGRHAVIASAHSADGLNWKREIGARIGPSGCHDFERIESCALLKTGDRSLRMYFGALNNGTWRIYTTSSEDGLSWDSAIACIDRSANPDFPNAKDPAIIEQGDGYRIFFNCFAGDGAQNGQKSRILTATSADRINWNEPVQCKGYGEVITGSPTVVSLGVNLRMYFTEFPNNTPIGARIVSAISSDGIQWIREPGLRIDPHTLRGSHGVFGPDLITTDDGWRMYFAHYWGTHLLHPLTLRSYR